MREKLIFFEIVTLGIQHTYANKVFIDQITFKTILLI